MRVFSSHWLISSYEHGNLICLIFTIVFFIENKYDLFGLICLDGAIYFFDCFFNGSYLLISKRILLFSQLCGLFFIVSFWIFVLFFNLNMLLHFNSYSENVSWKKQEKEFKIYTGLSSSSSCPDSWRWKHRPVLLSFLLAHSYELKIFNLWRRNSIFVKVIRRWSSHLISEMETCHWIQTN